MTTANGYPYPDGNDPVRNGDNVIAALANALPPKLIYQAGTQNVTTSGASAGFIINFPTAFKDGTTPMCGCTAVSPQSGAYTINVNGGTLPHGANNTRSEWAAYNSDGSAAVAKTVRVRWWAVGIIA